MKKQKYYLYLSDTETSVILDLLKEKLYEGKATRADITMITRRLGDEIAKVYGFSIPKQRQTAEISR